MKVLRRAGVRLPDRFAERTQVEQASWIDANITSLRRKAIDATPKPSRRTGRRKSERLPQGLEAKAATVPRDLRDRVAVITFHFNPQRYARPEEVYRLWRPSMGDLNVVCIEMVLGNDSPEIPGSTVVRGSQRNVMWQKERMVNIALERLPKSIEYVAWVDHDILFDDPRWLERAIKLVDETGGAVQPWNNMRYLDQKGSVILTGASASYLAKKGKYPQTGPGAAWVARREDLDRIGGIYDRNIVGGGDLVWFHALSRMRVDFLNRQSPAARKHQEQWIEGVDLGYDCLEIGARHIWHGDKQNRQYVTRDEILRRHEYDPETDVEIGPNGLLRWTGNKPGLEADVRMFFAGRKEDG